MYYYIITVTLWILFPIIIATSLIYIAALRSRLSYGINRCSKHLVGKVTIVTGSNIGIGFENAKDFADRGARVILACRNERRGLKARDDIIAATGNSDVHYYQLDLSSLESIRKFAEEVKKNEKRIDILVNNAGDFDMEITITQDGLLLGMQVNFFGPFLLTNLLLPLLKSSAPSRIVNVSSSGYKFAKLNLENLNEKPKNSKFFSKMGVYSHAKLCTNLTTVELNKRLEGTGVTVNAVCPGFVGSNIFSKMKSSMWRKIFDLSVHLQSKDCWQGAQTQIYVAVSPELNGVGGKFISDCKIQRVEKIFDEPVITKKLWEISERLVGLNVSSA